VKTIFRFLMVAAMLAASQGMATAQTVSMRHPLISLDRWADATWLTLLDRDGSYFGRLAEQGTLQRFNRLMDHEYELDLETGLFSAAEDVRWAPVQSGFRGAGASISHPLLLTQVEWRQEIPVAGPLGFTPRYVRHHTLSARRDYLELEAEWRRPGPFRALRGGFGVHAFKASGDLQVAALLGSPDGRGWSAAARVALVDAFTNPVFSLAANDPAQADTHFHYSTRPVAARLDLAWASQLVRFQAVTGVMRTSTVEVTFPNTGDSSFTQRESFRFAAGLMELGFTERFGIGLFGTTVRARTARRFEAASTRAFDLFEETSSIGGRGRVRLDSALAVEFDSRVIWRPERRDQAGEVVRHHDREVLSQVVLIRRPPGDGWLGRLGVTADTRRAGVLAPQLHDSDSRLLTEFGWRFRSGFEASFGVRWDLDASGTFDGGHLRLIATW
jgi:hypothetical protein